MLKRTKKLSLHKQTLRALTTTQVRRVRGGGSFMDRLKAPEPPPPDPYFIIFTTVTQMSADPADCGNSYGGGCGDGPKV